MSGIRHRFLSDTAIQVFAIIMMIFERVQGAVERYSSAAVPGIACIATACTRGARRVPAMLRSRGRALFGWPSVRQTTEERLRRCCRYYPRRAGSAARKVLSLPPNLPGRTFPLIVCGVGHE